MSLVLCETHANHRVPLWLDTDITKSNVTTLTIIPGPTTLAASSVISIGTITFPSTVTWCSLQGWVGVLNGNMTLSASAFLSETTVWQSARTPKLTSMLLTGTTINPLLCDNLTYYNPAGFTTLNLVLQNESSTIASNLTTSNIAAIAPYGGLGSFPLSGWSFSMNQGNVIAIGG